MLLSSLGVKDKEFLRIQKEHFERLENMLRDPSAALMLLEWQNRAHELVGTEEDAEQDDSMSPVFSYLRRLQRHMILDDSSKLKILVPVNV